MKRFIAALLLASCAKDAPELVEARTALAERDRLLKSFRVTVETQQGNEFALHTFMHRAPNWSQGRITQPQDVELAFDGTTLVRIDHSAHTYDARKSVSPEDLAKLFMPFVPEGFRAPLLPSRGVTAKRAKHARSVDAVELSVQPGDGVTVTWVLRMPSGDFLEKRTVSEGKSQVLMVVTEHCDAALRLCVPTKLKEFVDEKLLGTTTVTMTELNPELPQRLFAPQKPAN